MALEEVVAPAEVMVVLAVPMVPMVVNLLVLAELDKVEQLESLANPLVNFMQVVEEEALHMEVKVAQEAVAMEPDSTRLTSLEEMAKLILAVAVALAAMA